MGHEDAVYLAKLAEQAERYEGSHLTSSIVRFLAVDNVIQRWSRT